MQIEISEENIEISVWPPNRSIFPCLWYHSEARQLVSADQNMNTIIIPTSHK